MILNCIAIDDEPLALGLIGSFISQTPFLKLVGSFGSAMDAMNALKEKITIHLIFLDIQMPKLSGIELARLLYQSGNTNQQRVVFTTAYNQFAVDSYKVDALDYLVKPFNYEDFLRTANKGIAFFETSIANHSLLDEREEFLFVRVEYQLVRIAWEDILYIEGLKDYVKIHLTNSYKAILTLMTMKSIEEKLPTYRFMRIQRSFIIALNKISAVTKSSVKIGEADITIGDQYKPALQEFLSKWL